MTNRTTPVGTVDEELVGRLRQCPDINNARILAPGDRVPEVVVPTALRDEAATLIEQLLNRVERLTGLAETLRDELLNEPQLLDLIDAALTGEHQLPRDSDR